MRNLQVLLAARALGMAVLVIAAALAGCSPWPEQRQVQLPQLPPAWRHFEVALQLTLVDGRDGSERRLATAAPGARLALPVGRHRATVILAEPLVVGRAPGAERAPGAGRTPAPGQAGKDAAARLLRPAGAVVPVGGAPAETIEVTWERGLLAGVVRDLWRGGTNPWLLNLERLDHEITTRAQGDPWWLNRAALLAALQADAMSRSALKPHARRNIDLELPAGRWVWWNPFAAPLVSDGNSPLPVAAPDGYHLLLRDDGRAVALQVDGDGTVLTSPAAPPFER